MVEYWLRLSVVFTIDRLLSVNIKFCGKANVNLSKTIISLLFAKTVIKLSTISLTFLGVGVGCGEGWGCRCDKIQTMKPDSERKISKSQVQRKMTQEQAYLWTRQWSRE